MRPFLALTGLLMLVAAITPLAVEPDDHFVRIYTLIQQADALKAGGRGDQARQKYLEARAELESLRKANPGWNESVVEFRLKYIAEKLGQTGDSSGKSPPGGKVAEQSLTGESTDANQLLQAQVHQLTADKELLQAKLKEALTAQPAAVDPRELSRAEERIRTLEKQVGVLKAELEKAESKPDKPVDPAVLEDARRTLEAVSQKLGQQTEMTATATLEKEALQKRLQSLIDGDEMKALRSENASVKKQTGEPKTTAQTNAAMMSALQTTLQSVQRERDELQRKLDATTRELDYFKAREPSAQTNPRMDRIALPGARIDDFNAGKTSNRPEPLTLLKPQDTAPPEKNDATGKKSPGTLPPAAASLVAEAEQAFAARHYDEAEKKYSAALRLDGKNAVVLARLATVQIEQGRLADAERNLEQALLADPKDASNLTLLGVLKIREKEIDAALDALSRAAQLDPTNADTFQHLGVALAGKGLSEPAESAFLRALQLAPNNAEAHHGLAAVYAGQQPPSLQLARQHYQKALRAGCAKDPGLEKILNGHKPGVRSE